MSVKVFTVVWSIKTAFSCFILCRFPSSSTAQCALPLFLLLCEVLTWLHLLSALSCQTDDKGRTIFTLGVLLGDKEKLCKTVRSTLCITCWSQFRILKKTPLTWHFVFVKNVINSVFSLSMGWPTSCFWPLLRYSSNFLSADHCCAEVFLSKGGLRKSQHSVCQKWSENQMVCYNLPSFA